MPRSTYASLNTQPGLGPPSGLGKAEPRRVAEDIPSGAGATQCAALPALPAPLAPPCPPPSPAHLPVPCPVSWLAVAGTYLSNQPVSFTLEGVVGFNPLVAEEIRGSGRPLPAARRPRRPRPPRPECAAGRNGRLRRQLRAVDRVYVSGEGGVRGEPPAHLPSPPNRAPRLARPRPTPPRCARRHPFGGGGEDDALRGGATRRGRAVWRPAAALQAGRARPRGTPRAAWAPFHGAQPGAAPTRGAPLTRRARADGGASRMRWRSAARSSQPCRRAPPPAARPAARRAQAAPKGARGAAQDMTDASTRELRREQRARSKAALAQGS